jgi:aminoacyl tRNA synthase complex-interacting multifunctional protein 1
LCTLLVNLRPKTIKGYESKGMLLTATSGEETQILNPPVTSHPGELVYFTGVERKPPEFLPARKNAWNKTQPEMKTREDGIACWTDVVLTTDKGDIKSIENGIIG